LSPFRNPFVAWPVEIANAEVEARWRSVSALLHTSLEPGLAKMELVISEAGQVHIEKER